MIKHRYGNYDDSQLNENLIRLRKKIFFLLLYVDPKTKSEYENVDVDYAFETILKELSGLNSDLLFPSKLVEIISLLEGARLEYSNDDFNFKIYRKFILDAGAEIKEIMEV